MSNLEKREILLVDDDEAVRDIMGWILTRAGYRVRLATDPLDALSQLQSTMPDVIISDLNMPKMSGPEFLAVVRRRFPQIPVIAMSGLYRSEYAVPDGVIADVFYAKGWNSSQELLNAVDGLIHMSADRARAGQRKSAHI